MHITKLTMGAHERACSRERRKEEGADCREVVEVVSFSLSLSMPMANDVGLKFHVR